MKEKENKKLQSQSLEVDENKGDVEENTTSIRYEEIIKQSDGIYEELHIKGKYKGTIFVSKFMEIAAILCNVDNNTYRVKLKYINALNIPYTSIFPLEVINDSKKIISLSREGVDVNSDNAYGVFRHLQNEIVLKPECYYETEKIGFVTNNIFNAGKIYSLSKGEVIQRKDYLYIGKLNMDSLGTWKEYKKIVQDQIIGNTALEFALTCGFAAPLVPYLSSATGLQTLLIHSSGQTTTGKSTAAKLVGSVFGQINPNSKQTDTLFKSWNTTDNGVESAVAKNFGIPLILDEFGKMKIKKGETIDTLIYRISEGVGKIRSTVDGKEVETNRWSTLVFSNGERTLFENTSNAEGLRTRVMDLRHIAYTKSAEQAERLSQSLNHCSGIAGKVFIKHLLTLDKNEVTDDYNRIRDEIANQLQGLKYQDRIAKMPAIIMLTAELLEQFGMLKLNKDKICKLLVDNIMCNTGEQLGMAEKAIKDILEIVAMNEHHFYKVNKQQCYEDKIDTQNCERWGILRYDNHQELYEIDFITSAFKKQLSNMGYDNITTVIHELKNKKYLNCEKCKNYRKRRIGGVLASCYIIKL